MTSQTQVGITLKASGHLYSSLPGWRKVTGFTGDSRGRNNSVELLA